MRIYLLALGLLAGCAGPDPWRYDRIANKESSFDTSRLVYNDRSSHLHLEFLKLGSDVEAFLFLDQYRFAPASDDPKFTEISFKENAGFEWNEIVPMREGKMRLKLSKKTASRLASALQEGREVAILAGGFQETFRPGAFKARYERFLRGDYDFLNALRGPLE